MAVPPDLDFGSLTTLPVWLRVLGARDLPNSLSRTRSPTRKSVVTTICCFNFSGCSLAAKALIAWFYKPVGPTMCQAAGGPGTGCRISLRSTPAQRQPFVPSFETTRPRSACRRLRRTPPARR